MSEILVTVSAGIFGMAGAGLLAWALGPLLRSRPRKEFPATIGSLLVLIPAHNEEHAIAGTVRSILAAAQAAGVSARVLVGADACTDQTARIGREAGAQVEVLRFRSKWKALSALVLAAKAKEGDWVALVDAGALWPHGLLQDILPFLVDGHVLGVAPAYFPKCASLIERLLWRSEALWKYGENRAGGPMSVHGATVLYRAEVLSAALSYLATFGRECWLNDDVAIPFAARLLHPGCSLVYWCPRDTSRRISDSGLRETSLQVERRSRMVAGNLEWALTIFPAATIRFPGLAMVALRRLLRIFWAYWIGLTLYGIFLWLFGARDLALLATSAFVLLFGLVLIGTGKRGILGAALASLAAPFLIYPVMRGRKRAWG